MHCSMKNSIAVYSNKIVAQFCQISRNDIFSVFNNYLCRIEQHIFIKCFSVRLSTSSQLKRTTFLTHIKMLIHQLFYLFHCSIWFGRKARTKTPFKSNTTRFTRFTRFTSFISFFRLHHSIFVRHTRVLSTISFNMFGPFIRHFALVDLSVVSI